MWLRLKIVYLFPWYLFEVKKWLKIGIAGMMLLFLLEIQASFFKAYRIGGLKGFQKKIFLILILKV